ncbi:MAG: PDZ domain-containing protein [Planctomycetota bacterium]|nr:MAG: PDZ domain-containing protein [Planctomycetota bacterium]
MNVSFRCIAAVIFLALFFILSPAALSGGPVDIKSLEKKLVELAAECTPKTVCIRNIMKDMGGRGAYGSGAVISPDGYILTCSHVVVNTERLDVFFPDGRTLPASLIGECVKNDYALLKVDAKNLEYYELGDSDSLSLGDWVCALGHPGGPNVDLQPAFSAGRVTGLDKALTLQLWVRVYAHAVQTDVPIFAGNSGGPLVDLDGRLLGLNGAIIIVNEKAYAVAINLIKKNLDALKRGENVEGEKGGDLIDLIGDPDRGLTDSDLYERVSAFCMKHGLIKVWSVYGYFKKFRDGGGNLDRLIEDLEKLTDEGEKMPDLIEKLFGKEKDEKKKKFPRTFPWEEKKDEGDESDEDPSNDEDEKGFRFMHDRQLVPAGPLLAPGGRGAGTYRRNKRLNAAFAGITLRLRKRMVDIRDAEGRKRIVSGVLIEGGKYVITSASLLGKRTDKFKIVSWNGTCVDAKVLGRNTLYDVALLEVKGELANTGSFNLRKDVRLEIGQWVVSVGITSEPEAVGVVSALKRRIRKYEIPMLAFGLYGLFNDANRGMPRSWPEVIQHDGPLSSDKLGTALVDAKRRFVGLNVSAPFRSSSLAVPAHVIARVLPDLKAGKDTEPEGFLEVETITLSKARKKELELTHGVVVTGVQPGSGAGKAKIQEDDIILEIAGEKVKSSTHLSEIVTYLEVGRKVTVRIQRNGKRRRLRATIGRQ